VLAHVRLDTVRTVEAELLCVEVMTNCAAIALTTSANGFVDVMLNRSIVIFFVATSSSFFTLHQLRLPPAALSLSFAPSESTL